MSERFSASNVHTGLGDRIAGAVVMGFAVLLWFVVIPDQVDHVDYGWMRPRTLPGICTALIGGLGFLLLVFPKSVSNRMPRKDIARLSALVALVIAALWAISQVGFLIVAPIVAAVLVALLRENRWPWILASVAGAPLVIWLIVAVLLQRPLP